MKLITIATYSYPHEMAISRSKLEAHGIECFVRDELTVQVHNFYSNAIGEVKLEVQEQDVKQAIQILKDSNDLNVNYSESNIKCQVCDSGNIDGKKFNGKLSLVIWVVLGIPIPIFSSKYHCYDCHKDYKFKKDSIESSN